jgi:hypothetical protein
MNAKNLTCALVAIGFVLGGNVRGADAHGLIGKCFLPATLATDDPFVADELSLPTISHIKQRASGDTPPRKRRTSARNFRSGSALISE